MRIIRAEYQGKIFFALLHAEHATCLNKELGFSEPIALNQLRLLPAVAPSKIICMGMNYRTHAEELRFKQPALPIFFLKAPTTLICPGQSIICPAGATRLDYEGELAVVIGKTARNIALEDVPKHIFGFTCANDVTARNLQTASDVGGRCKNYDTFCPIGPWIETELPNLNNLNVVTLINGETRQKGNTADMILNPYQIVEYLSSVMTLIPGDVILTGTPAGVGPMRDGDTVTVEIEGIGQLSNTVIHPTGAVQ